MKWLAAAALALTVSFGPALAATQPPVNPDPTVEITVKIGTGDGAMELFGSGVHIGSGVIITAAHVVEQAMAAAAAHQAATVTVTLDDAGKQGRDVTAHVLWAEPKEDIAAIQIDSVPSELGIATLDPTTDMAAACGRGDCGDIEVVGQPFGLDFIHTFGRIAGTERAILDSPWQHAVPIDVRVGPGNSGGPVYRAGTHEVEGIVVGMISHFLPFHVGDIATNLSTVPAGVNLMVSSQEVAKLLEQHHTLVVAGLAD